MPSESQTRAVIHPTIVKLINEKMPKHKLDQGISAIINDLAFEALDTQDTMKRPPGRYSCSSNSSSFEELESMRGRETFLAPPSEYFTCHEKYNEDGSLKDNSRAKKLLGLENEKEIKPLTKQQKKIVRQAKETNQLPDEFLNFWQTYNTAPRKANQSRKKAFEAWKIALQYEKSDRLIEAARRAVLDQTNKMQQEEWFEPLPDCYRWLRDEKFVVLLEAHVSAKAKQIIPGVTVL